MKDFDRLVKRFHEFGGVRLLITYYRMGVLGNGMKAVWKCARKNQSFKNAYPEITRSIDEKLAQRYGHFVEEAKARNGQVANGEKIPHVIWSCWLQGADNMPKMVSQCIASQQRMLPDYEHRLLTIGNIDKYVDLPNEIIDKYKRGIIPAASFSDILRLCVLKKYGGVWMDASVYCSGLRNMKLQERWQRIESSPFTVFRYFQRGIAQPVGLSTWFIAATKNNVICSTVLDMLVAYWRDFDCLVDYYLIHLFMGMCLNAFPEMNSLIPHENSFHSLLLGSNLAQVYDDAWWQDVAEHVSIHKLNYRKAAEASRVKNSFYNKIFN